MHIMNSKIVVGMLRVNKFMQLHIKNVKINVWFYSSLKLLSLTH